MMVFLTSKFHSEMIISDSKVLLKSSAISLILLALNVSVNWFVVYNLATHHLLNVNYLNVRAYRIIIATCQLIGSILCCTIIDFFERIVSPQVNLQYFICN